MSLTELIYCGLESYVFSSCDANRLTVDLPTCSNSIYFERTRKKRWDEILESTSIPLRGVGSGVTWTRDPKVFFRCSSWRARPCRIRYESRSIIIWPLQRLNYNTGQFRRHVIRRPSDGKSPVTVLIDAQAHPTCTSSDGAQSSVYEI